MSHDYLSVDDLLSDEDRAIRDTVRDFAQTELAFFNSCMKSARQCVALRPASR